MIKLCVFADVHYIDTVPNWDVKRKLVEYADILTKKLVDRINNDINPDLVINLGDLIQASNNIDIDKKNLLHVLGILEDLKMPCYNLLGNHELKSVKDNSEILEILKYNKATFSVDIDKYHLVFIGTNINEEDKPFRTQYISKTDLERLKEDFETNINKPTLVFSHFGIAEDSDIKDNFWCYTEGGENLMLRNRKELKKLFSNKNILAVFCGHQHWTKLIKENGIDYYMLGSLTENIKGDGIPDGVYFEVELDGNNITIKENHLTI